jgi:hypothetical protein
MATQFDYYDEWRSAILTCPKCDWKGTFEEGAVEYHDELMDSSCPQCEGLSTPMLAIVSYPTISASRSNWNKLSDMEKDHIQRIEQFRSDFEDRKLRDPSQLPDIDSPAFTLLWDYDDSGKTRDTLIKHGDTVIFRERAAYEGYNRFIEVAEILRKRYGPALQDLIPTQWSEQYLYGDRYSAIAAVDEARREIVSAAAKSAG